MKGALLVSCMALAAATLSRGPAGQAPGQAREWEWSWSGSSPAPFRELTPGEGDLYVDFKANEGSTPWWLGAGWRENPKGIAKIQVLEVVTEVMEFQKLRIPILAGLDSYQDHEFKIGPGKVTISLRQAAPNRRTVLYLQLPRPMELRLAVNGRSVLEAMVKDSLLVDNGRLMPGGTGGLPGLVLRALYAHFALPDGLKRGVPGP